VVCQIFSGYKAGTKRARRARPTRVARVAEALEPRCRHRALLACPVIIEGLESRIMLSAFTCSMSGVPSRSHLYTYSAILTTTDGQANKFVVHWNDPNTGGSITQTYYPPAGGAPYTATYTYKGAFTTGTITVVATSTTGATATAHFALNSAFGNFDGVQGTGLATDNPYGNTGSVGQTSMVLDNVSGDALVGEILVAHSYASGGSSLFGITAFKNGQIDGTFGSIGGVANSGTYVVPPFGGGSDVPFAIAVAADGSGNALIVVVGKCASGWAIATVDTAKYGVSGTYGTPEYETPSSFEAGQANAVTFDNSGNIVAAGTDGTHIVAAQVYTDLSPYSYWGPGGDGIVTVPLSGDELSAGGNAVIDEQNTYGSAADEVLVGGYTSFCCGACGGCGGTGPSGSDYTLVPIEDGSGTVDTITRTNIGAAIAAATHCSGGLCDPSADSVYSLVPYYDGTTFAVDAVGQSNAEPGNLITVAQYPVDLSTGVPGGLVSGFGQYSGIATGPSGSAQSAVLVSTSTGAFAVTGTYGNDIITCQFTGTGGTDTTFGNAGVMYQDFGTTSNNSTDNGFGILLNSDGSLIVVGNTLASGATKYQIALVNYLDSNNVQIT